MKREYGQSPMWALNNETRVTKEAATDLTGFKSGGVNYKLALWDPQVNGVRYLKALIYHLCGHLGAEDLARMRRIRNRDVGDPIAVRFDGETICMDYLQAVSELGFIGRGVDLAGLEILEIGAGYGRTCHAMLSNHDVAGYHIIDLENSLELARSYLGAVLDAEQFAKVHFLGIDEADGLFGGKRFGLCLNIDSFAEMGAETVRSYLALIDAQCDAFYVNNPVGKYLDKSLDGHSQGEEIVAMALSTGLMRDIIDIHDNRAVEAQVPMFTDAYRPGAGWEAVVSGGAVPWSYYWQVLYKKTG